MTKHLIIKIKDGQWYATLDGKHLTAAQTSQLIAAGATYEFIEGV